MDASDEVEGETVSKDELNRREAQVEHRLQSVSYTHLTLPTIYSV